MEREKPYYGAPDSLESVYTLTDPHACYDFHDLIVVYDHDSKKFYTAIDSGCSCPSPFESHVFPTDFTELRTPDDLDTVADGPWTKEDVEKAKDAVRNFKPTEGGK